MEKIILLTQSEITDRYRRRFSKCKTVKLREMFKDPFEKGPRVARWRPAEVRQVCDKFVVLQLKGARNPYTGKETGSYCVAINYKDLYTGHEKIK